MFRYSLLLLFLLFSGIATANGPVLTFETKENVALQRARAEGKHVFILFKAQWCAPCRWMESTTFQDEAIRHALSTYYVPVKADIDEGDGFVLFYDHGVQVLPTMIILDRNGEVLERIEESLGRDKLLHILEQHSAGLTPAPALGEADTGLSDEPDPFQAEELDQDEETVHSSRDFSAPPAGGYSVQVGVFTLYPNVLSKILDIQAIRSDGPVHVEEARINDVVVYKLLSGHFASRAEAEAWRATLAEARIPGYIRDLKRS